MPEKISAETLALLEQFVQDKGLEIDKVRSIVAELVGIRDRIEMVAGHLEAITASYSDDLRTADDFVRSATGLGKIHMSDIYEYARMMRAVYHGLLEIPHGRTEAQEKQYSSREQDYDALAGTIIGTATPRFRREREPEADRPEVAREAPPADAHHGNFGDVANAQGNGPA